MESLPCSSSKHRHVGVRMRRAVLAIDREVTRLNAIGFEDARLQTTPSTVDKAKHLLDFVVVYRRTWQERAGTGDVGVHHQLPVAVGLWARRQRRFSSMYGSPQSSAMNARYPRR